MDYLVPFYIFLGLCGAGLLGVVFWIFVLLGCVKTPKEVEPRRHPVNNDKNYDPSHEGTDTENTTEDEAGVKTRNLSWATVELTEPV